ncbi:PLP-dependent transferase [Cryobacterium sp. TMT1-21]|uniref:homocysteine desulfhydrase n=1 Tax=Cryobacterium shii TaxID=1259235 RepID=A0AAQ2HFW1_9MICO|nr:MULTISPECIES: PLP-dependent aspartate aminotransferase family protein [Cryobacterium]TFC48583.1 PLP-dependent transferase [Cryobacterium shii]TFC81816.1 PLP-dependent transferase [Cryobacterium sp. TmT2-59]TFD08278.1 PLP-dependent transferase [Cryobacterium sp. TMT1-21]TFD20680.1 PLP-dependent transferase [Cryobacterium sp. TMT4-10]TFD24670.1 PLP-dependent transferase [Cryobacterium sp. TMT2-23]
MMPTTPHLETIAVHAGMEGVTESGSHVPVIDLSTTNPLAGVERGGDSYENLATGGVIGAGDSAVYQRLWQPGVARFETALSALEGTEGTVAFASGMAALAAVLIASVAAGTPHIVALRPIYGGTDHVLATGLLGTTVTWVDAAGVAAAIRSDTGLVILESPANPSLALTDIRAVADAAGRVPVLVDNTFATPVLQRPVEAGATLVLHSATKFLGGHGDVMGGTVSGPEDWLVRLRQVRALTGGILHPFAAYLLHRGLRTLPVRVRAQQATAAAVAEGLVGHPALARVLYPGLPGQDPQNLIGRQCTGAGSIIALDFAGGFDAAVRFTEACRLITHAVSLGGVDSLVQHPASLTHRPVEAGARPGAGIVRISIGLEHPDDLLADILAALDVPAAVDRGCAVPLPQEAVA